ncbi:MAG: hypothetical protein ACLSDQ_11565 [Adlercreutzia equolifaciens]
MVPGNTILSIMGAKVVIGMVMGFIVDAVLRLARRDKDRLRIHELCEQDQCGCNHDCRACEQAPERAYEHHDDVEHTHEHGHGWRGILRSATKHTVQVTLFIFVITIALNAVLEVVGEDALAQFLGANRTSGVRLRACGSFRTAPPAWSSLSCMWEGVWAGAMLAGLLVSAGVGAARAGSSQSLRKQNVAIIVVVRHRRVLGPYLQWPGGRVLAASPERFHSVKLLSRQSSCIAQRRKYYARKVAFSVINGRRRWRWQAVRSHERLLPPMKRGSTSSATTTSPAAPSRLR